MEVGFMTVISAYELCNWSTFGRKCPGKCAVEMCAYTVIWLCGVKTCELLLLASKQEMSTSDDNITHRRRLWAGQPGHVPPQ